MTAKKNSPVPFETALAELESLVGQLEHGELSLEESLRRFERGIGLVQSCQNSLRQAEQKVEQLIERNGQWQAAPLNATTS
ncbi:MAG: exodeoxyribonuclease VII small subunit [Synechococcaceae cyanobacterium SM1_2_3]|nr:exodeoxyribonuclease VII small subunit [Synechococcaceae cyanobacterium SM1_2_3]